MAHPQLQNEDDATEQLVAYLDGELSKAESAQVEERLAADANYRAQLRKLKKTWELLDQLPRPHVADQFTETTVEMVVVEAADDLRRQRFNSVSRRLAGWMAVAGVGLLACFFSFRIVQHRLDEPNRQLLQDLPVVENVDLYYHAEDISFVEQLEASGVFDEWTEPTISGKWD